MLHPLASRAFHLSGDPAMVMFLSTRLARAGLLVVPSTAKADAVIHILPQHGTAREATAAILDAARAAQAAARAMRARGGMVLLVATDTASLRSVVPLATGAHMIHAGQGITFRTTTRIVLRQGGLGPLTAILAQEQEPESRRPSLWASPDAGLPHIA